MTTHLATDDRGPVHVVTACATVCHVDQATGDRAEVTCQRCRLVTAVRRGHRSTQLRAVLEELGPSTASALAEVMRCTPRRVRQLCAEREDIRSVWRDTGKRRGMVHELIR